MIDYWLVEHNHVSSSGYPWCLPVCEWMEYKIVTTRPGLSRSRVVLIDARPFQAPDGALPTVDDHLDGLVEVLTDPLLGGLLPSCVRVLRNPSLEEVEQAITRAGAEAEDFVTVYFFGDLLVGAGREGLSLNLLTDLQSSPQLLAFARLSELLERRNVRRTLLLLDCRYFPRSDGLPTATHEVSASIDILVQQQIAVKSICTIASPVCRLRAAARAALDGTHRATPERAPARGRPARRPAAGALGGGSTSAGRHARRRSGRWCRR